MLGYTIASKGRPAEIMVIEDNFGDVLLIKKALQKTGVVANICVAEDGQTALDMLMRKVPHDCAALPDIILLDINLPKMSGSEILGVIKGDPLLRRIPVIVMSSSKARIDISRCYDLHANGYILKPSSLDKLTETINSIAQFWFNHVLYIDPNDDIPAR